ncbi:MAG: S8 family peptidase, partial [Candidatus Latescibacterota bacterium]
IPTNSTPATCEGTLMHRYIVLFSIIVLLTSTQAAAGVHVDARIMWEKAKRVDGAHFMGSLRFAAEPAGREFEALEDLGVEFFDYGRGRVGSRTVYPAKIPFKAVERLKTLDFLIAVECARDRRTPPPLAVSRPQVEADLAWQVNAPGGGTLSGDGVIVCDIDTGVNYLHSVFFKLSGESFDWLDVDMSGTLTTGDAVDLNNNGSFDLGEHLRWHESAGTSQHGNNPTAYDTDFDFLYNDANNNSARDYGPPTYGENDPCYGERVFLTDDTNDNGLLDVGETLLALGQTRIRAIYNRDGSIHRRGIDLLSSESDSWGHGTQVTGIFGGGWVGLHEMSGIAPGIESLHVDYDFAAEPPFLLPIEAGMAWAVAEGANVIIIEDGEWVWEYLDGSSNVEIMINEFAADDSVIFIVPAGNLATGRMHTRFNSNDGEVIRAHASHTILWPSLLWRSETSFTDLYIAPPGESPVLIPADGTTLFTPAYKIYSNFSVSTRGTRRLDLRMATNPEGGSVGGDWVFSFTGPDTDIHGYFGENTFSWTSDSYWVNGQSQDYTVTWPATADSAITVTAYTVAGDGDIDSYSGWGPRIDEQPIVDIAAPGRSVYSASPWNAGDFSYFAGTSGAGPHVAGAAALLKELFPDLDNGKCREYLRAGAGQDGYTTNPNRWGAGKLRIYSAISRVLTGIAESPPHPELELGAYPNPFNPGTTIRFKLPEAGPTRLRVFDVTGREIWSRKLNPAAPGWQAVSWPGQNHNGENVASGVYFAHVRQGGWFAACKMVLVQ